MMEFFRNCPRYVIILLCATSLLLLPVGGMVFSDEVNWSVFDFIIAAVLLCGTGLMLELILRKVKSPHRRLVLGILLLILLVLVWAELAVGVFGFPLAGN